MDSATALIEPPGRPRRVQRCRGELPHPDGSCDGRLVGVGQAHLLVLAAAPPIGHAVHVPEQTADQLRDDAAAAARQTRAIVAALTDPADELTASAATRHRLEGAALALEAISRL